MPARMKARSVLILLGATVAAALAIAGCGGGGDDGSSSTDPASIAPPDSLFYLEVNRPKGKAAANVDALAKKIAGIDDLGEFIVSELESSAGDSGGEVDYAKEIEPWLGEKAAFFPRKYDGDDFSEGGAAVQTTDAGEAEEFLENRPDSAEEPVSEESYEGVDYRVDSDDGSAIGVIGDFVAYAEDQGTFEAMVDASDGESLADDPEFTKAIAEAPKESVADVWVDIGALVQQGGEIDSDTETGLSFLGIEPEGATAVASAIPGSDQIEIEFSSDAVLDVPPPEDNSFLLGSMPGDSVAAFAISEVGESFAQSIDRLDREGIPDEDIKPGELKKTFEAAGVDLDSITSSITNLSAFVQGSSESSLGGAAVLITAGSSGKKIAKEIGAFLRLAGVDGVTSIGGKVSGFSVRNSDLDKPVVVLSDGLHIVVSYRREAAANYYSYDEELNENPVFKEATASLNGLPIAGFADGPAALRLALNLVSGDDREDLLEAKPYLSKIDFLALASESTDKLAKVKLVARIGE
jgi:Protein of unknown function (DUF3352)